MLHFLLGVAEFELRTTYGFLKISKVQGFLQAVQQMKNEVRVGKAYAEFFNLFYFLLLIILGKLSILFIIIYVQFVKFKYKMNQTSHLMVNNSKNFLKEKVARVPAISALLGKAIDGLFWVITY
jgi:preprotein translocase subunit SecY